MAQFPLTQSAGSFGGNLGGAASVWNPSDFALTRPNNATAYANNNAVGSGTTALFKFSGFFRAKGSTGLLSGARIIASVASIATTNMGAVRMHLFNFPPTTAAGLADQGTFNTLLADDSSKLGTIDFSTWNIGGGGSDLIESYGAPVLTPLTVIAAPNAIDLYVVLVATAAFTPIANSKIIPYISAVLD